MVLALECATLAISTIGALSGITAAVIAGKLSSKEADRQRKWEATQAESARQLDEIRNQQAWHRDQVTETYRTLLEAAQGFQAVLVEDVLPTYSSTPVGDIDSAWRKLSKAHGNLLNQVTRTFIVARPSVFPFLAALASTDAMIFVPLSGPQGPPQVAMTRWELEHEWVAKLILNLSLAMRVDLGLADERQVAQVAQFIDDLGPIPSRSLTVDRSEADLRELLRRYGCVPFPNGDPNYGLGSAGTTVARLIDPALPPNHVAGVLHALDSKIFVGVERGVNPAESLRVFREIALFVESGLRDGPPQRDTPDGGRIALWQSA